jgi:hypothetical protein
MVRRAPRAQHVRMNSYHELELLAQLRIQNYLAEAASDRIADQARASHMKTSVRKGVRAVFAAAVYQLATWLEPTPIRAELLEACPAISEVTH